MKSFICCTTLILAVCALSSSAEATPITYQYVETGATRPGWQIHASVTIDGTFADLPTLTCNGQLPPNFMCPTNFGTLLDFASDAPYGPWTLQRFILNGVDFATHWSISPGGIYYQGVSDLFQLDFGTGTTFFASDGLNGCYGAPGCTTTGYWAPIPEPFTGGLLGLGLIGVAVERLRARRSRSPAA